MRIALIGYGKMGKAIEKIALERGHEITGIASSQSSIENIDFNIVDVAIEFTIPELAVNHIKYCTDKKTPIVVGTTAWNEQLKDVSNYVNQGNGALLYASNFSIGVNIFFEMNRQLAKIMNHHSDYTAHVDEIHHLQKLDAPSGTAITIAEGIIEESAEINNWKHEENIKPQTNKNELSITSFREEGVPGTHQVTYTSEIDTIEIKHTAHNRKGFALGAVIAAEWLFDKQGVFTMKDVIKF